MPTYITLNFIHQTDMIIGVIMPTYTLYWVSFTRLSLCWVSQHL